MCWMVAEVVGGAVILENVARADGWSLPAQFRFLLRGLLLAGAQLAGLLWIGVFSFARALLGGGSVGLVASGWGGLGGTRVCLWLFRILDLVSSAAGISLCRGGGCRECSILHRDHGCRGMPSPRSGLRAARRSSSSMSAGSRTSVSSWIF